jgi:hypothetical protein
MRSGLSLGLLQWWLTFVTVGRLTELLFSALVHFNRLLIGRNWALRISCCWGGRSLFSVVLRRLFSGLFNFSRVFMLHRHRHLHLHRVGGSAQIFNNDFSLISNVVALNLTLNLKLSLSCWLRLSGALIAVISWLVSFEVKLASISVFVITKFSTLLMLLLLLLLSNRLLCTRLLRNVL